MDFQKKQTNKDKQETIKKVYVIMLMGKYNTIVLLFLDIESNHWCPVADPCTYSCLKFKWITRFMKTLVIMLQTSNGRRVLIRDLYVWSIKYCGCESYQLPSTASHNFHSSVPTFTLVPGSACWYRHAFSPSLTPAHCQLFISLI